MQNYVDYTGVAVLEITDHDTGETKIIKKNNVLTLGGQYTILNALVRDQKHEISSAIFGACASTALDITNTIGTFTTPYTTSIESFSPPSSPTASTMTLSASWNLSTLEYNGNTISEIGLVGKDVLSLEEVLFCRITLSAGDQVGKTSNISINGAWYITVTESAGA